MLVSAHMAGDGALLLTPKGVCNAVYHQTHTHTFTHRSPSLFSSTLYPLSTFILPLVLLLSSCRSLSFYALLAAASVLSKSIPVD